MSGTIRVFCKRCRVEAADDLRAGLCVSCLQRDELARLRERCENAELSLASVTDAINTALREDGPTDVDQIKGTNFEKKTCDLRSGVLLLQQVNYSRRLRITDELARLRERVKELERPRMFPIQGGPSVPWEAMEQHAAQARENHGQSLERLAARGGLGPAEAWFVVNDRQWDDRASDIQGRWTDYAEKWNRLSEENERLKREFAKSRQRERNLMGSVSSRKCDVADRDRRIEELERERADWREHETRAIQEAKKLRNELDKRTRERDEAQAAFERHRQDCKALSGQLRTAEAKLERYEKAWPRLRSRSCLRFPGVGPGTGCEHKGILCSSCERFDRAAVEEAE